MKTTKTQFKTQHGEKFNVVLSDGNALSICYNCSNACGKNCFIMQKCFPSFLDEQNIVGCEHFESIGKTFKKEEQIGVLCKALLDLGYLVEYEDEEDGYRYAIYTVKDLDRVVYGFTDNLEYELTFRLKELIS